MKYMGSKNRVAKEILPIMLKERGQRTWVEPFVGGANMIDKVDGNTKNAVSGENNSKADPNGWANRDVGRANGSVLS